MQLCHQSHKRHIQAKHAEHLQGYPIPDSLKKVKQFEEKEYGKEDADDPDLVVENQPGTSTTRSIQGVAIFRQKKETMQLSILLWQTS